jgi:hypothetical protein
MSPTASFTLAAGLTMYLDILCRKASSMHYIRSSDGSVAVRQMLLTSPGPFSPTKQLQAFLAEWEHHPETQADPSVARQVAEVRQELVRRKALS